MTKIEAIHLTTLGFSPCLVNSLAERGYEPLGTDPDDRESQRFLRRTTLPDFIITLKAPSSLTELDDAIYHAGRHDQQTHIRHCHEEYLKSIRFIQPLTKLHAIPPPPFLPDPPV